MTEQEISNGILNIQNTAKCIVAEGRPETVDFILAKYGAESIEQIPSCYLSEVFNELYAVEADLRSG